MSSCVTCGSSAQFICPKCRSSSYCSQPCFQNNWESHQYSCSSKKNINTGNYSYYWKRKRVNINNHNNGTTILEQYGKLTTINAKNSPQVKVGIKRVGNKVTYKTKWKSTEFIPHKSLGEGYFGAGNPDRTLGKMMGRYGLPNEYTLEKGGMARWKESSLRGWIQKKRKTDSQLKKKNIPKDVVTAMSVLVEIILRDEQIPHYKPVPHVDYLYYTFQINIPPGEIRNKLSTITKSMTYDPLKKWLVVRCHFEGANWATILAVVRMLTGKYILKQAKDNYGTLVKNASKPGRTAAYIEEVADFLLDPKRNDIRIKGKDF